MPDWQIALAAFHLFALLVGLVAAGVSTIKKSEPSAVVREAECQRIGVESEELGPCPDRQ
jgi:hypothetical protein